ncbi:MAG: hypothetical protein ACQESG_06475 [Nanobdellota archaeon]
MEMNLNKIEENLTCFSSHILERLESDIKGLEETSARLDETMKDWIFSCE